MWSLDLLLTIVQLHYNVISGNKTMDLGFIMLNITVDIKFILFTECKDIKGDTIIMFFYIDYWRIGSKLKVIDTHIILKQSQKWESTECRIEIWCSIICRNVLQAVFKWFPFNASSPN